MTFATAGSTGSRSPRRPSIARSGTLAGATISVWNAWLTGSRIAVCPRFCSSALGGVDRVGRAAEHDLVVGVDVGEDDVAVDLVDDLLDLRERRDRGDHHSGVVDLQMRHLAPAGADRLERGSKVNAPAATSAPYSPRCGP